MPNAADYDLFYGLRVGLTFDSTVYLIGKKGEREGKVERKGDTFRGNFRPKRRRRKRNGFENERSGGKTVESN